MSSDDGGEVSPCIGPQCDPHDAAADTSADVGLPDASGGTGGSGGSPPLNPLCQGDCVPDHESPGCDDPQADAAGPEEGGAGASSLGDAKAPDAEPPALGCYLVQGATGQRAECAPGGSGQSGAPCSSSFDCAPGHGCVGEASVGQCRPFCCAGSCDKGSYCAERTLLEPNGGARGPVCVKADNCDLNEPYPCMAPNACTCMKPEACMVVSADGTTSCVEPGSGRTGEECPCAWGYVCSVNKCRKLCDLNTSDSQCGGGMCQATTALQRFNKGVCVGVTTDASP